MSSILVTGADKGLGLELVRTYCADGADVIACALAPDSADELRATGARVLKMDVTRPEDIMSVSRALNGQPLDLLINNAGITGYGSFGDLDYEIFERAVVTNLFGSLRVSEALLANIEAGQKKTIATVTSGLASIADRSYTGALPYRASKAALNMGLRCMAEDLADKGVKVLSLHPGHIKTDMGGPYATVDTADSAAGLKQVIEAAPYSGELKFLDWEGRELPW